MGWPYMVTACSFVSHQLIRVFCLWYAVSRITHCGILRSAEAQKVLASERPAACVVCVQLTQRAMSCAW